MMTNLKKCARCGKDHDDLEFKPLADHAKYSYYATCPTNGQPILMKVEQKFPSDAADDSCYAIPIEDGK